VFEDLDGSSRYSVRMKGINSETGEESNYSELYFMTTAEQLFTSADIFVDRLVMHWLVTDRVTHLSVFDPVSGAEIATVDLSASDIANGAAEISGLQPGIDYRVVIFNEA